MNKSLSVLNNHPQIWRARDQKQNEAKFSLGFPRLDKALNGGVASTGLVRISSLTGVVSFHSLNELFASIARINWWCL